MEAFVALFGLGLLLTVVALPIVALVKASRVLAELRHTQAELRALEERVTALARVAQRAAPAGPPSAVEAARTAATPEPAPGPPPRLPVEPPPPPPAAAPVRLEPPPPARRLTPPPPRPPVPPSPPPSFDWEGLLGLRGAAWLGGIALVIAAAFFAKWAIEQDLITPQLRIAGMVVAGVGCLVWAELSLRRGYAVTANAVSGAGIAILYLAFFAAYSLYHLLPLAPTFVLMSMVTLLAGVVAVRYDAYFTAVLGLVGGFATPIVLSTGVDRPVGLFSYILLINVGLVAVALRKRWHGLTLLALAGTFLIELGWYGRFMAPEKMLVGLTAFLAFGILFLLLPGLAGRDPEAPVLVRAGVIGGTAPFLFAVLLAGEQRYASGWPLLFLYVGLLDAALIAVALLRGRAALAITAALGTSITISLWAGQGLSRDVVWGPTLAAIGLAALLNVPARLARRLEGNRLEAPAALLELSGVVGAAGLGLYALVLVARGLGEPPWPFLALLAALTGLLFERTGAHRLPGVSLAGGVAIAGLAQAWFYRQPPGDALFRDLAVGLLPALALALRAALRAPAPVDADEDEIAAVGADAVFLLGLFGCLASPERGGDPWPLFPALAVAVVLLIVAALRRDWTVLLPGALASAGAFSLVWQEGHFQEADVGLVLPVYLAFAVGFLWLPFLAPAAVRSLWRRRAWPWLTSALSCVVFFLPLHQAIVAVWGKAWIGVLPVALAALTLGALAGVARRFVVQGAAAAAPGLRLRYLALFTAVVLGFVAVAIPLQLDRQWITIGWALEGAAVWWLYGRLAHRGLIAFGAVLLAGVGVRLLVNPEVLRYEERGWPVVNWLLYTYGVPALCCFAGAAFLRKVEPRTRLVPAATGLGLLLVFWLINLEIADFFSSRRYLEFTMERRLPRDLALSVAWGLYGLALLVIGIARGVRALRFVSLGVLLITVAKVFLYDLSTLTGLYRIVSFLGLGVSLILVSLLYQRFVFARETRR